MVLHSWGISAINWFEDWKTADRSERVAIAAIEKTIVNVDELVATVTDILDHLALLHRFRDFVAHLGYQTWYEELFDKHG